MGVELLTERHKDQIAGLLSCYDQIIIQGTVPGWCYASGMTGYFYAHEIRIFDYPKWPNRCGRRYAQTWSESPPKMESRSSSCAAGRVSGRRIESKRF